jgi:hypothetical protein
MARETTYVVQAFNAGKGGHLKPDSSRQGRAGTQQVRRGSGVGRGSGSRHQRGGLRFSKGLKPEIARS